MLIFGTRPEVIAAGTLKLVGTTENIYMEFARLLSEKAEYERMSRASNHGLESNRIADIVEGVL